MIHINKRLINNLIEEAKSAIRKRKNFNFHPDAADPLHRMLHAMEPDTYVQPHKHENPDKCEAFIILQGRIAAIEYNNTGEVTDHIILDPLSGNFGVEFPPRTWHSLIALEPDTVVYEVKNGPWDPADDKFFASWAPKEGDDDCIEFNKKVMAGIGIDL